MHMIIDVICVLFVVSLKLAIKTDLISSTSTKGYSIIILHKKDVCHVNAQLDAPSGSNIGYLDLYIAHTKII